MKIILSILLIALLNTFSFAKISFLERIKDFISPASNDDYGIDFIIRIDGKRSKSL